MPKKGRRGYPTAILIGLDNQAANIWLVYSESIKKGKKIMKLGNDEKAVYKHYEEIVEDIRTLLLEGFNQLLIASTEKYTRKAGFIEYINRSHGWLNKKLTVKEIDKKAVTRMDVLQLVKMNIIQESVAEASVESNENVMERLEKALNSGDVVFTIEELSYALRDEAVPEFILVTEKFDKSWRGNRRYQSMIQRAKNMRATVTIVKCDVLASARLEQLGGFVSVIRR